MDAYSPAVERKMKRLFDSLRENDQRRYAAVEATKLGHGGIDYIALFCGAIPRLSAGDWRNLKQKTTWTPIGSEKRGWTEKADRDRRGPRTELLQSDSGPHSRRSDAGRCEMDELVTERDRTSSHCVGNAYQPRCRVPVTPQTQVSQEKGIEEEDNGSSQSQSQRSVREHRPLKEGVSQCWLASYQHGYQKKGVTGRFLSRRQGLHRRNHRGQ